MITKYSNSTKLTDLPSKASIRMIELSEVPSIMKDNFIVLSVEEMNLLNLRVTLIFSAEETGKYIACVIKAGCL